MVRRSLTGGLVTAAGLGAALLLWPGSASADSFYLGYSAGHRHRHHHRHHRYHHHHWPRYHHSYYYAPPVYYPPPPPVVYLPAPPPLAVSPTSPAYRAADGRYCREYQATVTVNGVPQPTYGTACLQPDGTWRIVN